MYMKHRLTQPKGKDNLVTTDPGSIPTWDMYVTSFSNIIYL